MNRDESIVSDLSCWAVMSVFAVGLVVLAIHLKSVQIDDAPDYNYEKSRQSVMDRALTSARFFPPTVTARASGFSRRPPQAGQTSSAMYSS